MNDTDLPPVLPTRVGMVRDQDTCHRPGHGSPHPRGDGPQTRFTAIFRKPFSPPAWGWSGTNATEATALLVLPTRVGMVRMSQIAIVRAACSPHPRGDGP